MALSETCGREHHYNRNDGVCTRRSFLFDKLPKGLAIIAGVLFLGGNFRGEPRRDSFSKVVRFLAGEGIPFEAKNNGGDRTLVEIGDTHFTTFGDDFIDTIARSSRGKYDGRLGDFYVEFIRNLSTEVPIDRIFMEGVLNEKGNFDSYEEYVRRQAKLLEKGEVNLGWLRKTDPAGYYRLRQFFEVVGIDSWPLAREALLLSRVELMSLLAYQTGSKDPVYEGKARKFASQLEQPAFSAVFNGEWPAKVSPEELQRGMPLLNETQRVQNEIARRKVNFNSARIIDSSLEECRTGVVIAGDYHFRPKDSSEEYGTLETELWTRGINTIYIPSTALLDNFEQPTVARR